MLQGATVSHHHILILCLKKFFIYYTKRNNIFLLLLFKVTDEKDLETSLNAALECGYRHIDTANAYNNEHIIGRVLKKWFQSGKLNREDIFVTTKLPAGGVHPDR